MRTNIKFYSGNPDIAVRKIIMNSKMHSRIREQCRVLEKAVAGAEYGSSEQKEKVEELKAEYRRFKQLIEMTGYTYNLFRTVPDCGPRMLEAEKCFLESDFEGMDVALPEEVIRKEIEQAKNSTQDGNSDEAERQLQELSYELILKGLLCFIYDGIKNEWYVDFWRFFTDAQDISKNTHTFYYYGWYCMIYKHFDNAEAFLEDAVDKQYVESGLTEEYRMLYKARCMEMLSCIAHLNGNFKNAADTLLPAARLFQRLNEINPKAYLPEYFRALYTMGNYHIDMKWYGAALEEYEESIKLARKLSILDSNIYGVKLAGLLDSTGALYVKKDNKNTESVEFYEQGIAIMQMVEEFDHVEYIHTVAGLKSNLAALHSRTENSDKVIPLLTDVIALRRELILISPENNNRPRLAYELCNMAIQQNNRNNRKEAYRNMTEGIGLYRECSENSTEEELNFMGKFLDELDGWLWQDNRREEAIAVCREKTEIYRNLSKKSPNEFMPKFAKALDNLAAMYHHIDDEQTSLEIYFEAIEVSRKLVKMNKGYSHILGILLMGLAVYYTKPFPDRAKALAAAKESCRILDPIRKGDKNLEKAYAKAEKIVNNLPYE